MVNKIKRKLYNRGSSYETTKTFLKKKTLEKKKIMPMLLGLDDKKKYNVVFLYENGDG